jgi:hypothetical protein
VERKIGEVVLASKLGQSMFQPARREKEQLSIDRAGSGRGVTAVEWDLGAAKGHRVHRWLSNVAPSPGASAADQRDLEDEGRDISYGVTPQDQIITGST